MSYEVYLAFMGCNGYQPIRFAGSFADLSVARARVTRALNLYGAVVIARLTDASRRVLLEVDGRDMSQRGELASGPCARPEPPGRFDDPYTPFKERTPEPSSPSEQMNLF